MTGSWTFDAYVAVIVLLLCGSFAYWLWQRRKER